MLKISIVNSIYIFILIVIVSCEKENECDQNMELIAPVSVNEGEDIHLSLNNPIKDGANTYYYWTFPDMRDYSMLVGGSVEVSGTSDVVIEKARVTDEGKYTFKVDRYNCDPVSVTKYIKVIPKVSPCIGTTEDNILYLDESFSSPEVVQPFTPALDYNFGDFSIILSMPAFTYDMKIKFDRDIPEKSSTYLLRNFYQNFQDTQIPSDEEIHAYISFAPSTDGYDYYRLEEAVHNLYLKRDGDQLILTFCDVPFEGLGGETIVISGKVKINL